MRRSAAVSTEGTPQLMIREVAEWLESVSPEDSVKDIANRLRELAWAVQGIYFGVVLK